MYRKIYHTLILRDRGLYPCNLFFFISHEQSGSCFWPARISWFMSRLPVLMPLLKWWFLLDCGCPMTIAKIQIADSFIVLLAFRGWAILNDHSMWFTADTFSGRRRGGHREDMAQVRRDRQNCAAAQLLVRQAASQLDRQGMLLEEADSSLHRPLPGHPILLDRIYIATVRTFCALQHSVWHLSLESHFWNQFSLHLLERFSCFPSRDFSGSCNYEVVGSI